MSFINERCAIIRRSDKDMFYMYLGNDGLYYNYYDDNGCLLQKNKLINYNNIDFTKYSISIDKDDNIYCIYCDKSLEILKCSNQSFIFKKIEAITYNYKKFALAFPYVKYIEDNPHIFYYVFNNNSTNTCALFHHYKHKDYWIENKIDFINHIVLNNFTVLWNGSIPTIFYFNLVNGCEEVFASRFNLGTFTWSDPIQITNSGYNKLYLSEPSTCMYPELIKNNSKLLLSWVNYNKLFTCTSTNDGLTWSKPNIDEYSLEDNFIRSTFYSNYKDDLEYNISHVFSTLNDVGILGL